MAQVATATAIGAAISGVGAAVKKEDIFKSALTGIIGSGKPTPTPTPKPDDKTNRQKIIQGAELFGLGLEIFGGLSASRQAKQNADYNIALYQSELAQLEAKKKYAVSEAAQQRRLISGAIATRAGASGIGFGGSPIEILSNDLTQISLDEQMQKYNIEMEQQRTLSRIEYQERLGKDVSKAKLLSTAATALTRGTSFYEKYWGGKKK